MPQGKSEATPNVALYNLRDMRAETQEQVAAALNVLAARRGESTAITGNHVSRWERGIVHPSPLHRQLLAEHFGATVAELGLVRPRMSRQTLSREGGPADILSIEDATPAEDPRVIESQQQWFHVRRRLTSRHHALARAAAQLYPAEFRVESTGMLARPDWRRSPLIKLGDIELAFDQSAKPPLVDGTGESTGHVRPLRALDRQYQRYSHAVRDVARPRLFENRPCWRLLQADFSGAQGKLRFGDMNYFDAIDVCEALSHETAATHLLDDGQVAPPTWRGLHLRKTVGDPFDLERRALITSINTLTVRLGRHSAAVVLHNRSAENVATSGGVIGVMPAGVFQPSTVRAVDHTADFDLWRNIMREYSEEFLGNAEHVGDGAPADYGAEPLRSFDTAYRAGRIRVYCFGIAVGALDLWGGIETVAVFDAEVFDELFAGLVKVNDEGTVLRVGRMQPTALIPFTKETVDELWATDRLAPETAFSLHGAWENRDQLFAFGG